MKKRAYLIFIILFTLIVTSVPGYAVDKDKAVQPDLEKVKAKLDKLLSHYMKTLEVTGMAIGVLKDDEVIYSKALGVKRMGSEDKVTTRSLFHMASISKPFVAAAVMQLVEKGKIKLEGKLTEYLPYFKLADPRYKDITIGQMLRHRSAMPGVKGFGWSKPLYGDDAVEKLIRSMAAQEMSGNPGERMRYSNAAFDILAGVIAQVSGMTFEQYVKENIFIPLGMKDSTFLKKDVPEELGVTGHEVTDLLTMEIAVNKFYPYNRARAGSSTLHSNVPDMMRWARANLNGGILDGKRFLKEDTLRMMWAPSGKVPPGNRMGLSWSLGNYKGVKTISHTGGDVGFRAYFVMFPEKNIAIVAMGNSGTMRRHDTAFMAFDLLMGNEPEKTKQDITVPLGRMLKKKGAEEMTALFHRLKKEQPDKYLAQEWILNKVGYQLIKSKRVAEGIEILKINVAEYPDSWDCRDLLAEGYLAAGDREKALIHYKKALEQNPKKEGFEKRAAQNQEKVIKELESKK
ncbi:MAG: serine hydrolase [bacterium]|nr:serine hydrolase [bacterium]